MPHFARRKIILEFILKECNILDVQMYKFLLEKLMNLSSIDFARSQ